ncbi:hypothetical protein BAUCODRAFT_27768 [Baudoinia panamericana UAMH 10762]|uniref:Xylanolytic transcriptional activator regulatory domain-containing protein n=1 Tax=Baudoinia panamericana (strain UAMH 10762) TaxID=717646 RepID=M2MMB0_BAUPA|nr:uncharacterized protein BAUCODRAFT_27768 [Baudoinia panamericana UAMH 10762]EMC92493.1 hypothetical protein BAUCODRAFT_27768 [Baudoinia panamericana UAMH 10762]
MGTKQLGSVMADAHAFVARACSSNVDMTAKDARGLPHAAGHRRISALRLRGELSERSLEPVPAALAVGSESAINIVDGCTSAQSPPSATFEPYSTRNYGPDRLPDTQSQNLLRYPHGDVSPSILWTTASPQSPSTSNGAGSGTSPGLTTSPPKRSDRSSDPAFAVTDHGLPHWPPNLKDDEILQYIDIFFDRLYSTLPVVDRHDFQRKVMLQRYLHDSSFAALVLSMCAFALLQPVYHQEYESMDRRQSVAKDMLQAANTMRSSFDFGENMTLETVLTSFFMFAALFGLNLQKAALLRLREAAEVGKLLGLHRPDNYAPLGFDEKSRRLRLFYILAVTERGFALQRNHSSTFSRQHIRTMSPVLEELQAKASQRSEAIIVHDQRSAPAMHGLLQLIALFESVDAEIVPCFNRSCTPRNQRCMQLTTAVAIKTYDAIKGVIGRPADRREGQPVCSPRVNLDITYTTQASSELSTSQYADCFTLQQWLLIRLWVACLAHDLLSADESCLVLSPTFPVAIAWDVWSKCNALGEAVLEVHGLGMIERIHDVAMGVVLTLQSHSETRSLVPWDYGCQVVEQYLGLLARLRNGQHPFHAALQNAFDSVR